MTSRRARQVARRWAAVCGVLLLTSVVLSFLVPNFVLTLPIAFTGYVAGLRMTRWFGYADGRDSLVHTLPIGSTDAIGQDDKGLHYQAQLYDNSVIKPDGLDRDA